jgi:hypothetical protein
VADSQSVARSGVARAAALAPLVLAG